MSSSQNSPGLIRALGPVMAAAVVVGTVIGTGVFKKPQAVAENVHFFGPAALLWILGGVMTLMGALAYAEVLTIFPRAGGNYVVLREAYGRIFGFLWGWVDFLIIKAASMAALATVVAESLNDIVGTRGVQETFGWSAGTQLGFWPQRLLAVAIILGLALVNVRGVRWGGGLNLAVTTVKVASLLMIICLPFVFWGRDTTLSTHSAHLNNLSPAWPDDLSKVTLSGLTTAMLGVLFAYHGWVNLAPVAGEVRNPDRNLPLALLAGVGTVLFLYLGANFAYALVIPQSEMAAMKNTPVATEFSLRLLGPSGKVFMAGAVMCSAFGALNGMTLVGPRLLYAMGVDGLIPPAFGRVHPVYRSPVIAILMFGAWSAALVLIVAILTQTEVLDPRKSHFDMLSDFAMFGAVTFESLGVLSIFVFRRKLPDVNRPYRCWGYPVVPALYGLVVVFILANMFFSNPLESLTGVGFIVVGVIVYYVAGLAKECKTPLAA